MFKVVDIDDLKAVLKAGVEALVCVTFLIVYKDYLRGVRGRKRVVKGDV
jgi:hypothetical protein